jgi:histone demethylase JARID1
MLWACEAGVPLGAAEAFLHSVRAERKVAAGGGTAEVDLGWSLRTMHALPASLLHVLKHAIAGVTRPWVYVGMLFTSFCWHNEDNFLCSINYHHGGAPKLWYGAPGPAADAFESAMRQLSPALFARSVRLLHQIVTAAPPGLLRPLGGMPLYRVVQRPGDCVVTFPRAYHAGFNLGVRPPL